MAFLFFFATRLCELKEKAKKLHALPQNLMVNSERAFLNFCVHIWLIQTFFDFCICDLGILYLMAPSSSLLQTWRYPVFAVFHREDVPRTFLSDLRVELSNNASTIMFEDQRMERSQPIAPGSVRESRRISIVVLTKNYASSSWCLDELVEILKCKKKMGHRVITVFYGVDPSDVRKQTGEFGIAFDETCARKTQEERQKWSQALTDVANIIGYHLGNWDNEANTIETIARDVSYTLNATTSRDNLVEPPSSNKPIRKSKSRHCCTGMAFLVVINLLLEIASAVADQLGTIRKPYFPRISLVVSILSVVLSILDLNYKIRAHKAGFRWKWRPIPWFHYPSGSHYRIFGSFTDTVLLFCVVGQLIVSTINCISIGRGQEGPIKVSVWPLFFAIGMVISNFMEKPANSEGTLPLTKMQ